MNNAAISKKEISDLTDIRLLVNTFYERVRKDQLLSPIFGDKLAKLEPLYRYWQSILLEQKTYPELAFPMYADMPLTHQHFDRWLSIFHKTVDDLFTGHLAEVAKIHAIKMSEVFRYKMELISF